MGGQALIVGLLVFIGLLSAQTVSFGQTPAPVEPTPSASKWSAPYAFERSGWFPDITTDSSGRIHVAWSNSVFYTSKSASSSVRSGYDVVLYTSSSDGGNSWETVNEIAALKESTPGNIEVTRPAMLVDPLGVLHMTFRDINVYYSHVPAQLSSSARDWSKPIQVTTEDLGYFSRMVMDLKGRLNLVYSQAVQSSDCLICYHIFYRQSDDHGVTWSDGIDISLIPTGSAKPQILIDDQDNIHVVWEAGRGGTLGQLTDPTTVMYTVSYNRGETWAPPIEMAAPKATWGKAITIGKDGTGNLVVVWWSLPEDVPYYEVSMDHGLSWSEPLPIPQTWGIWARYGSRLDSYTMAEDSAGNLHLVMAGRLSVGDQAMHLLHLVWNGTNWSVPETIVSYDGDAPEWPRLAISNGNQLNVVWFVRPRDFIWTGAGDYYKVFYSHTLIDAPAIKPVPYPTLVPPTAVASTLAATRDPLITQAPTIPPVNATVDPSQTSSTATTEVGQLNILMISLIPALILVGVLLIFLVVRRR